MSSITKLAEGAVSRREFLQKSMTASLAIGTSQLFSQGYQPLDPGKKLRIGVVGGGFGASFPWNKDPNCEVAAVAELRDDRRKYLMEVFRCSNAYGEFHPMLRDQKVDAVAIFVGAPDHVAYCVDVMNAGKHVICAVPASIDLEGCQKLIDIVTKTGQIYMNAETGCFRQATMAARELNREGKFGTIYHSEGAYYHDHGTLLESGDIPKKLMEMFVYEGKPTWRMGMVPGYYTTHAAGPIVYVTGEKLMEVTAIGTPIDHPFYKHNQYGNPFICETMFFQTNKNHSARIAIHWWTTEPYREGADYCGTRGSFYEPWNGHPAMISYKQEQSAKAYPMPDYVTTLPPALRDTASVGHGGAEAFIVHEFVSACLQQRKPAVDVYKAVSFAAPGICGHHSAMNGGVLTKVPDFGPIS